MELVDELGEKGCPVTELLGTLWRARHDAFFLHGALDDVVHDLGPGAVKGPELFRGPVKVPGAAPAGV